MMMEDQGLLVLEDGSVYKGRSVGAPGEWVGEVVFNTSMTGYQEIITDPSYWGQMVCFTCPHIGNVGVNHEDVESRQPYVRAVLARQIAARPSNWRAIMSLPDYLREHGVPALEGIDTRRLTLTLRERGVMRAALSTVSDDEARLLDMARHAPDMSTLRPIPLVSVETQEAWEQANDARWTAAVRQGSETAPTAPHVVVVDCGVKSNILRCLVAAGARVTVAPEDATPDAIRALQPDGLLIANGPGDPEQAGQVIDTVQALLGELPVLGICMGHQVLALALGARTYKLPFGHHGGNHPVQNLGTGEVEITAQNHNFAVDPDSLADLPVDVTHRNLYDGTVEGLRHRTLPITSVQYHPEASPGPHDSLHIISAFVASLHAAQGA